MIRHMQEDHVASLKYLLVELNYDTPAGNMILLLYQTCTSHDKLHIRHCTKQKGGYCPALDAGIHVSSVARVQCIKSRMRVSAVACMPRLGALVYMFTFCEGTSAF